MKKRILSLAMSLAMFGGLISMPMVTYAAQTVTESKTVSADVSTKSGGGAGSGGSDDSAFVVAIPQKIELTRSGSNFTTFSGTYDVGVKAVLASGKKVTVTPAGTFDMINTSDISTKYTATVTQEKTTWVAAEVEQNSLGEKELNAGIDEYAKTTGTITVDIKKAGAYSGTLGFTVALQ